MHELFFFSKIIVLIVIIAAFIFILVKSKDRWVLQVYKNIFTANPGIASMESFPVNHTPKFPGLSALFTEKATGIIAVGESTISFLGYKGEKTLVKLHLPKTGLETAWVGKLNPFSRTYWFLFKTGEEQHYFCAETGKLFSKSEGVSKDIFDKIRKHLK